MLLTQNDPFRNFDLFFGGNHVTERKSVPMDAYRRGDDVWVHMDLPGIDEDSLDIDVERSVLTVTGERFWNHQESDEMLVKERSQGAFRRQVHLGDGLDLDSIEADLSSGVLTIRIPLSERAKPKKIPIGRASPQPAIDAEVSV